MLISHGQISFQYEKNTVRESLRGARGKRWFFFLVVSLDMNLNISMYRLPDHPAMPKQSTASMNNDPHTFRISLVASIEKIMRNFYVRNVRLI